MSPAAVPVSALSTGAQATSPPQPKPPSPTVTPTKTNTASPTTTSISGPQLASNILHSLAGKGSPSLSQSVQVDRDALEHTLTVLERKIVDVKFEIEARIGNNLDEFKQQVQQAITIQKRSLDLFVELDDLATRIEDPQNGLKAQLERATQEQEEAKRELTSVELTLSVFQMLADLNDLSQRFDAAISNGQYAEAAFLSIKLDEKVQHLPQWQGVIIFDLLKERSENVTNTIRSLLEDALSKALAVEVVYDSVQPQQQQQVKVKLTSVVTMGTVRVSFPEILRGIVALDGVSSYLASHAGRLFKHVLEPVVRDPRWAIVANAASSAMPSSHADGTTKALHLKLHADVEKTPWSELPPGILFDVLTEIFEFYSSVVFGPGLEKALTPPTIASSSSSLPAQSRRNAFLATLGDLFWRDLTSLIESEYLTRKVPLDATQLGYFEEEIGQRVREFEERMEEIGKFEETIGVQVILRLPKTLPFFMMSKHAVHPFPVVNIGHYFSSDISIFVVIPVPPYPSISPHILLGIVRPTPQSPKHHRPLSDYCSSVDVHFARLKSEAALASARSIVFDGDFDTVIVSEVAEKACAVSTKAQKIVKEVEGMVAEAAGLEGHCSARLLQAGRSTLDLYRATMPVFVATLSSPAGMGPSRRHPAPSNRSGDNTNLRDNENEMFSAPPPQLSMVFHNDCMWIAHRCLTMGLRVEGMNSRGASDGYEVSEIQSTGAAQIIAGRLGDPAKGKGGKVQSIVLSPQSEGWDGDFDLDLELEDEAPPDVSNISKEASSKGQEEYEERRTGTTKKGRRFGNAGVSFLDMVPLFRKLGQRFFNAQLRKQKENLLEIILNAESKDGLDVLDDARYQEVERAFRQLKYQLEHLSKVWKPILPPHPYLRAMGLLVNAVMSKIVWEVEQLIDIAAEESHKLHELMKGLLGWSKDLFEVDPSHLGGIGNALGDGSPTVASDTATMAMSSSVTGGSMGATTAGTTTMKIMAYYVPVLPKYSELTELLEMSLADIIARWRESVDKIRRMRDEFKHRKRKMKGETAEIDEEDDEQDAQGSASSAPGGGGWFSAVGAIGMGDWGDLQPVDLLQTLATNLSSSSLSPNLGGSIAGAVAATIKGNDAKGDMKDFGYMYGGGRLGVGAGRNGLAAAFTPQELSKLVRALFADTPKRQDVLDEVTRSGL
ncbi:Centromere/kinetochore protein zw10 [Quaeritorhiza haematococci]|nr:Centromere/kinetochore protein zw10 [Quaeritorhiza haematococci]